MCNAGDKKSAFFVADFMETDKSLFLLSKNLTQRSELK
jgi:hypothetical protein